jgi:integrase
MPRNGGELKRPAWLDALGPRDEKLRAAHGLTPKKDGWYKSIGGKPRYVCGPRTVGEAVDALNLKFPAAADGRRSLAAGLGSAHTLEGLVDLFLAAMLTRVTTGHPKKLERRTYDDFCATLGGFVDAVGGHVDPALIGPGEFGAYAKRIAHLAVTSRRRRMIYVDRLFNWAGPGKRSMNLIPLLHRGPDWIKPSDDDMRRAVAETDKAYTPAQVIATAEKVRGKPFLNAAFHLGLNCGFIPKDVGTLPERFVDLDAGLITFPRGKTGVERLCVLVPETVAALREYLAHRAKLNSCRPEAKGLLFRTREGMPYARHFMHSSGDETVPGHNDNLLTAQWREAVGLPFSGLRSTFATIADDWHDSRAVDVVLGHKVDREGRGIRRRHYAKRFNPDRVRLLIAWLWPHAFGRASPVDRFAARMARAAADALAGLSAPARTAETPATAHSPSGR